MSDPRRAIPSVDRLLASQAFQPLLGREPRALVSAALKDVQTTLRSSLEDGGHAQHIVDDAWFAGETERAIERMRAPSLRRVINATGVVLHTNLGRAPLAESARAAMVTAAIGASNLEYDLETGTRGSRYVHCTALIERLTGAEAALVVNNNAAALVLALNTLASGREAVISRGELVEIGGAFRIPDIMERSGARMREVGSTNRTHQEDYARAVSAATGVLLKVHRSNFRVEGFTAEVDVAALSGIAREKGVPLLHDLGSGLLLDSASLGLPYEPTPMDVLAEGADLVTMSGDKLLGGPQAGILLGREDLVDQMRRNPLCRAMRVDKLTIAALEATLALYLDPVRALREIPVLRMLAVPLTELETRARRMVEALGERGIMASTAGGSSAVGGGALPGAALPTRLVRLEAGLAAHTIEQRLRNTDPPVIGRIVDDRFCLDPRTIAPGEEDDVVAQLEKVLG
ncbi:MAG: L-seryl-tRNA(Sec) selenium transferase [Longimicrobiales bacterium]